MIRPIYRQADDIYILDQTLLPRQVHYQRCTRSEDLIRAIKELQVRGAPLIGITAAYGMFLAVKEFAGEPDRLKEYFYRQKESFSHTRPTAVNLFWALARMEKVFLANLEKKPQDIILVMKDMADTILREDIENNQAMGDRGQEMIRPDAVIMTICNAGALATGGYGTALGVIRSAHREKKIRNVWVPETRPVLQGARLTTWELIQDQIPVTLITDSMAAYVMKQGRVDYVIVGADRIAANGDIANKIGTYALALAARRHGVPFFVAAPLSTFDLKVPSGEEIPIEERDRSEVTQIQDVTIAPAEVPVFNPAFDITPHDYIDAIICEEAIILPPLAEGIKNIGEVMSHD